VSERDEMEENRRIVKTMVLAFVVLGLMMALRHPLQTIRIMVKSVLYAREIRGLPPNQMFQAIVERAFDHRREGI